MKSFLILLFFDSSTFQVLSGPVNTAWKVSEFAVFSWSLLSHIRTEYGELLCKSSYSVRKRDNKDKKKLWICTLFKHWSINKAFTWTSNAHSVTFISSFLLTLWRLQVLAWWFFFLGSESYVQEMTGL